MRSIVLLSLLTSLSWSAFAAGEVSGKWTASFETQIGTQTYTYEFQVQGNQLTGTANSANGNIAITDGKVDGNTISFVENMDYQGMALKIVYTGEVAGDEIHFKRDVGGQGTEEFVAKRAP